MSTRQAKGHRRATITEARKICEEHGARQVIVLLFDGDQVSGASYGATKAECAMSPTRRQKRTWRRRCSRARNGDHRARYESGGAIHDVIADRAIRPWWRR